MNATHNNSAVMNRHLTSVHDTIIPAARTRRRVNLAALRVLIITLAMVAILPGALAQTVHRITAPGKFYVDDKAGAGIVYNYAVYAVSNNTGVTIPSAYVAMTNMVATSLITLAAIDTGVRALGTLEPGQTKLAAFFLKGPSFTGNSDTLLNVTNENHTIQVLNGPVGVGSVLTSSNYSFTNIIFVIEAAANKITIITNLNPFAILGSQVTLVIAGDTGTVGGNNSISFSPGVLGSWRPDAYELVNTVVRFSENPTFTNQLYFDPTVSGFTNFTGQSYTNTFHFRATKVTGTNLPVSPFAFVDSGSGTKHTTVSSLTSGGGSNIIVSATNLVAIVDHTANPSSLLAPGGIITYSVTFSNFAPVPIDLDEIVNTLPGVPANATYVPGSATFNGAPLDDPGISGQTLRWAQPFALPPTSSRVLEFQAIAPLPAGTYTNRVIGVIGGEQIDTSLATTDNSAAISFFTVIPVADIAVGKSAPTSAIAGVNFDYVLSVTNLGPSPADSLSVTDGLPAAVTFVSAIPPATFDGGQVVWTNLGALDAGAVTNLIITVAPPVVSMSLTNAASGGSATLDLDATNNSTVPVVTAVVPAAEVGITKIAPPVVAGGAPFNYTLVITNSGPSTASSVTVTDSLPASLTFVSASDGGVFSGGDVIWNTLGDLAANGGFNLTLTVIAPAGGSFTNIASAGSSTLDTNSLNNVTPPVVSGVGNVPPTAVDDTAATPRNVPVSVPVLANDSDDNGDALTLIGVTQTNGTASVNGANVDYSPATDFLGDAVLTYTVMDGQGGTNTGLLTISVTNRPPVAVNDTANATNGVTQTLFPLVNDSDLDGDALVITNATATTGIVVVTGGGTSLDFTPANNLTAVITYTVSDGFGGSATATITVEGNNVPPVPGALDVILLEDTFTNLVLTASDDETNLVFAILDSPTNGVLSGFNPATGEVSYQPGTNYFGPDSFTFTVFDGTLSATGAVTLTITPENDAPMADDLDITLAEDSFTNLVLTASDVDNTNLVYAILSNPTNGSLGTLNTNSGAVTYTPAANYFGSDGFTFTVFDGSLYATGMVSLIITPVNDAPIAVDDFATTPEDTQVSIPVLANDSDADNDPLVLVDVISTNGTATISGTNILYTPSADFFGTNVLTYSVTDGQVTNSASITVAVTPVNDAPVANDDSYTTDEDTALVVPAAGVLANDTDVDSDSLTAILVTGPANGTLSLNADGSFTYTPNSDYNGSDSFTYRASDGSTNSGTATVTITVSSVNDSPVADDLNFSLFEGVSTNLVLTASDVDGLAASFSILTPPANGGLSGTAPNLTYVATNFTGTDGFTFIVSDGSLSSTGTVSITVVPLADVAVMKSGPTNVTPGASFSYTITVTNLGPSAASNVMVFDDLPTNLVFVSASAGGSISNSLVSWPVLTALGKNAVTNFTIAVTAPTNGSFVNVAYATAATADPNMANNDGSAQASRVSSAVVPIEFGLLQSGSIFNPQTGLYEQTVVVTNISSSTVAALRLLVGDFASTNGTPRTNVWLWNAAGTNDDGRRYVQYNSPLDPGQWVTLKLEFYNPTRVPFTNSLEAAAVLPVAATPSLAGGVAIDVAFADNRIPGEPRYVIEWTSIPGRIYTVIYSDDNMVTWTAATPAVVATGTRTQWYDDGPPKTASKPLSGGSRFYRIILNP